MNKPTFDGTLRLRPRINVPRGYGGNEPTSITRSAPLSSAVANSGAADTIYSGQPIILAGDGGWVVPGMTYQGNPFAPNVADRLGSKVFFAFHDSTDTDVGSSGLLLGFSALGKFEIESAWFVDDTTTPGTSNLAVGDPLEINANGFLAKGDASARPLNVVGYVTELRDLSVGGHASMIDLTNAGGAANAGANPRGGSILPDGTAGGAGTIAEDNTSFTYDHAGAGGPDATADGMWIVKFVTAA